MQAGHPGGDEFPALGDAPFHPHPLHVGIGAALHQCIGQFIGQVHPEGLRQKGDVVAGGDGLEARNDGHGDTRRPALLHESEVLRIVEEHLGDEVLRSRLHLLLQVGDVHVEVEGLGMLLGIAGGPDAEVGGGGFLLLIVQVFALVQCGDLVDEVHGMGVPIALGDEVGLVLHRIATQGQHIVQPQEVDLDQRILGLLAAEATADEVGHGVDVVLRLDGRANADGAGALAQAHLLQQAMAAVLVDDLLAVVGDIDEAGPMFQQGVDAFVDRADVLALEGRQDLEGEQRAVRSEEVVDDLHGGDKSRTPRCWPGRSSDEHIAIAAP